VHNWLISGQAVLLVLAEPGPPALVPLVIYLPGLGESGQAGERWRSAWASAGYAVLSVQPLAEDAAAWTSELARTGEFKALGQQQFAGTMMARRLQMLAGVVGDAQRRATAGEAAWQRIDWDRMAIAGFDLGAYSAMTAAGERVRDAPLAAGQIAIRAAIAISPYASVSAGSLATRYLGIHAPVLSITSDVDTDAVGLVDGPYLRRAPFDQMAGPDKFLLLLQGLSHAALSGTLSVNAAPAGASGGRDRADAAKPLPALTASSTQLRLLAVQDVSTAFLDAYVKDDPLAREWLRNRAAPWLGSVGELRHK